MRARSDDTTKAFFDLIRESPKSVIQAGLGTGLETGLLRKAFPDACFTAFEPCPHAYKAWKLGRRGRYPGRIFRFALGDKTEVRGLYLGWDRSGFHRPQPSGRVHQVRVRRLDDLDVEQCAGRFADPCLFWLDVEGHELAVLAGGGNVMRKCRWIVVEVRHDPQWAGWVDGREVDKFLNWHGFERKLYVGRLPEFGNALYERQA